MSVLKDCVLIVDDEFLIAEGLRLQVEDLGLTVCGTAPSADEAIILALQHRPRIVLMDMRLLGDKDGVDASMTIHSDVGSKVIFVTGSREPSTIERIHTDHPSGILFKPVAERELRLAIEKALA